MLPATEPNFAQAPFLATVEAIAGATINPDSGNGRTTIANSTDARQHGDRMGEQTFWGIHGRGPKIETVLLERCQVAIGWGDAIGDLGSIGGDREKLKAALAKALPEQKPGAIPVIAGEIYRFISELAVGDVVLYRARSDGQIHLGRVTGEYAFDPTGDPEHPYRRSLKWLKTVSPTSASQGALYELGSALAFFVIRNYAEEWSLALAGKAPVTVDVETDESVALVSAQTQQNTRDFIIKRLSTNLKGHPFAHFVADLLRTMGYRTEISPAGTDGGIDIVAHKDELGFEPPIVKVQVKSGAGKVGGPEISQLIGNLGVGEFGLFVTLGTFAPQAHTKQLKSNVRLIDGDDLVELIFEHYEALDARYKSLIPLERIYVPQSLSDD